MKKQYTCIALNILFFIFPFLGISQIGIGTFNPHASSILHVSEKIGYGCTAIANMTGDKVSSITVSSTGSNYSNPVVVVLYGGGADENGGKIARASAVANPDGTISNINVLYQGYGYTSQPTVIIYSGNKAFLPPRLNLSNTDDSIASPVTSPADGLIAYNSNGSAGTYRKSLARWNSTTLKWEYNLYYEYTSKAVSLNFNNTKSFLNNSVGGSYEYLINEAYFPVNINLNALETDFYFPSCTNIGDDSVINGCINDWKFVEFKTPGNYIVQVNLSLNMPTPDVPCTLYNGYVYNGLFMDFFSFQTKPESSVGANDCDIKLANGLNLSGSSTTSGYLSSNGRRRKEQFNFIKYNQKFEMTWLINITVPQPITDYKQVVAFRFGRALNSSCNDTVEILPGSHIKIFKVNSL